MSHQSKNNGTKPLDAEHDDTTESALAIERDLKEAVQFILSNTQSSALIELYYWTQENDLLSIVRGLAAAPKAMRQALAEFVAEAASQQLALEGYCTDGEFRLRKTPQPQRH